MSSHEWFALMKPLIFWTWHDDGVPNNGKDEGSVTKSSLIIENKGTLPQSPGKPEKPEDTVSLKCNLPQAPGEKGTVGKCTRATASTNSMYSTGEGCVSMSDIIDLQAAVEQYHRGSIRDPTVTSHFSNSSNKLTDQLLDLQKPIFTQFDQQTTPG